MSRVVRLAVVATRGALGGVCVRAGGERLSAAQQGRNDRKKTETFRG
jgi:hypothetical protein